MPTEDNETSGVVVPLQSWQKAGDVRRFGLSGISELSVLIQDLPEAASEQLLNSARYLVDGGKELQDCLPVLTMQAERYRQYQRDLGQHTTKHASLGNGAL